MFQTLDLKKCLPDIAAVVLFILISFAYFFPADIEGKVVVRNDITATIGAGQETKEYKEKTGEMTRWTNGLFGGMPNYQISPSYDSTSLLRGIGDLYRLFLPGYMGYVFMMLVGFYILLRAFGISVWLSTLGAVAWAFSSYFFILMYAGHMWKFFTLAYVPPTIAGVVLAYRKRYVAGGIVTALFFALQLLSNHVQMTYYFGFVIVAIVVAYLIDAVRNKQIPQFLKSTGICLVAAVLAIAINGSSLYHTYEYSKETMRGKSELVKEDSGNQTDSGLERDYITNWSYGKGETLTLLVPNLKGGASDHAMAESEVAMKKANPDFVPLYRQIGQYWGEQPGTSGPVYVGALLLALAVLAMFILRGPLKWVLFAVTLLAVFLSWGKNMMWFTNLFIDYMPMYSKFRTVSSILVVAEFTIPLLAVLGLNELFSKPEELRRRMKFVYISFGVTGGLAFLMWLFPGLFFDNFVSTMERSSIASLPQQYIAPLLDNLTEMRQAVLAADAMRSFLIIAAGLVVLMLAFHKKLKSTYAIGLLALICLIDLWGVDKRYLNDSKFTNKAEATASYVKTKADEEILKDKSLDYRVLNMSVSTFNDNTTSYYHKSVGGYSAAKLRRYQEMIEYHIAPEMGVLGRLVQQHGGNLAEANPRDYQVLNMLNTKYVIVPTQQGGIPLLNPNAYGNGWFVDEIRYVENANQEIEGIADIDVREVALVDKKYRDVLGEPFSGAKDSTATVVLKEYEPNRLVYEVSSEKGGAVVFSEIFYPSWRATIDGKDAGIACADYILRAMRMPAGKHSVVFTFDPKSVHVTETCSYVAMGVLLAGVVYLLCRTMLRRRKERKV